ncbi:preprotein translocase subunit SecE [Gehongia tenuis]|uniref:Protein translocase subunit SecE n=1 Tax=Gehongia tenuis TaxID=2763655 RepID=A0A926D6R0_9FIRM|nr:preprotein translocase subunit SecE [Gehongia tenuis]MBC8531869.1 preprotein translocase subunit SecE [Gehongia tenuis]
MAKVDKVVVEKAKSGKPAKKKKERRFHPIRFFKEMFFELKKVTWPTRKELVNYTLAVVAFMILMAIVIGVVDWGFGSLLKLITS